MSDKDDDKVRLDKWLWAARFYKTRSLAKEAIEGGKVHCRGERCKPGKEPKIGDEYVLRTGFDERTIVVRALSVVRPRRSCFMRKRRTASLAGKRRRRCAKPAPWACRSKGSRTRSSVASCSACATDRGVRPAIATRLGCACVCT